jgi:hypothetical protein
MKLRIMKFSPHPPNFLLLGPHIFSITLFYTLNICSSLQACDQVSHPYKTTGKIIVLYILNFMFVDSSHKDKKF